ncbi:metallophosphatase family protein [Desulfobotulus sp. H1]|uniref:Phosphoesterase n=1 Tax=Desulfobotulus pelophilus TaxID=2823377 RepID=A0ABT3NCE7_9BACT|nr:metallophosphoesterase family protein [Desulfobotulus pelophilus]MCW7755143.1 metallophosphatase family protein [Desulfobotulus pelophilus]
MEAEADSGIRIGVLSDTHLERADEGLSRIREEVFASVSLILHAGDIIHPSVLDCFHDVEVLAVCGNCDGPLVREICPVTRIVPIGPVSIGLIHGWGERSGVMERARHSFENVDAVVFGHTHEPECRMLDGVLMFNPGSYTDNRRGAWPRTVGILTISSNGGISGNIFPVSF